MQNILVAVADSTIRILICEILETNRTFAATEATNLADAVVYLRSRERHFDAVLLDIVQPDGDGCDIFNRLRQRDLRIPVIMLAASNHEPDVIRCLQAGASDYIVRPIRAAELKARISAHMRANAARYDAVLAVGRYLFRPDLRQLLDPVGKQTIHLTAKETAVLKLLCRSDPRHVSRETLLRDAWHYSGSVTTHTVETHIYRLRRKLGSGDGVPLVLSDGEGYYLGYAPTERERTAGCANVATISCWPITTVDA